jgi:hypothetical protein
VEYDAGLEKSDELSRASARLDVLWPFSRMRGLWPEVCSSDKALRCGILTARLLLAVGLELDDDDEPTVGAIDALGGRGL